MTTFKVGKVYNWINQLEHLIFIGRNWSYVDWEFM